MPMCVDWTETTGVREGSKVLEISVKRNLSYKCFSKAAVLFSGYLLMT